MKLNSLVEIISGFAFNSKLFNDQSEGIPIVRIRDIKKNKSQTYYRGEYSNDYLIKDGDFLIGMDGEFNLREWKGGKALLNQRVCKIVADETKLHSRYLLYILPQKLKLIEDATPFLTVKHISVKTIKDIQIPLPPFATQRHIAAILDKADALRQKNQQLLATYDELLQSNFLDMFGDPVTNPKGWDKMKLDRIIIFPNALVSPSAEPYNNYYHVGGNNIESNTGELIDLKLSSELNLISGKFLFTNEHILYNKIRPYLNKVAKPSFTGICSADMYPILPKIEKVNKEFLYFILRSNDFVSFADNQSRRASIPKINRKEMALYSAIVPPIALQNQFAQIVENIEAQKAVLKQSIRESEDLFNALVQKAFNGELG